MLGDMILKDFIRDLASESPAPGGGGVAALISSLSSALTSMVFNLTIDKKVYNEYDDRTKDIVNNSLKEADKLKNKFLDIMDKDAMAFLSLMSSFKLPKTTQEEKKLRNEKIQEQYKEALNVPLKLAIETYNMYDLILNAARYGNKLAISDAGVAAILADSAIESSILNVNINLAGIKDEDYKEKIKTKCKELIENSKEKKSEIINIVNSNINL